MQPEVFLTTNHTVQILETFQDIDKATIASTVGPPVTSNHQEADQSPSLPKADDCFEKTSKWLNKHDVDSQTKRLAPQKDRVNNEGDVSDSDGTDSDLSESEKNLFSQEQSNSSRRCTGVKKVSPKVRNRDESTSNKHQKEIGNHTLPMEISDDDSDLDENDRSLVSMFNRNMDHDDGDSITPADSASCSVAPTHKPTKNKSNQSQVLQQVQNNSPPASQSSICSGFDNDSIAPIRRNRLANNPNQRQKPIPSTSRTRQHTPVVIRKPEKRRSESPAARSPQERRPWSPDEDRLLTEGFNKFKNKQFIWTLIKQKYFANSTRTNINIKDRARTLDLK